MASAIQILLKFVYIAIGLIFLSAFIGLFNNGIELNIGMFINNIKQILKSLISPHTLSIIGPNGMEYSIFLQFWDSYLYSLSIFLSALFLALLLGILLAYLTTLLSEKKFILISKLASLLESLPDLFIIIVIQFFVLMYFKRTGIMLFLVASTGQNKSYILPVIALSLIPSIMIYKVILLLIKEEMKESYINLAKSKGFTKSYIFFHHVLRNIVSSLFNHSKAIVLILLSSMVIFERIFNINGIFTYIIKYHEPNVIAFTLILFYLPIFLLYAIIAVIIGKKTGQRMEW